MLTLPIIDAHVHLWNPQRFSMPWLVGIPTLQRPYELEDHREQSAAFPVESIVYVEVDVAPHEALREAEWIARLAEQQPIIQGIVAAARVENTTHLYAYLDQLVALGPRIKGVRRNLQDEQSPGFCLQPAFVQGVQLLASYGLSFDICIRHQQLPDIIELVRRCPQTSFILDHLGKPTIRAGQLDPWREHIHELATLPNVVCKLSGMVTEADHQHWTPTDLAPYIATVLSAFGEDRVLFGGDWPVLLLACTYARWVETLDAATASLSIEARRKLWAENARRVYRLSHPHVIHPQTPTVP